MISLANKIGVGYAVSSVISSVCLIDRLPELVVPIIIQVAVPGAA